MLRAGLTEVPSIGIPLMCTRVRKRPNTSPATVALLARHVTVRMTKTKMKVRITSATMAPTALAPIIGDLP